MHDPLGLHVPFEVLVLTVGDGRSGDSLPVSDNGISRPCFGVADKPTRPSAGLDMALRGAVELDRNRHLRVVMDDVIRLA